MVVCADVEAVAARAADRIIDLGQRAIKERGVFVLALAGGSTPRAVHARLALRAADLDWQRVEIFFGDERAVGPEDPDSNYRMARETLIEPLGIGVDRVHRLEGECANLDAAARRYEAVLTARIMARDPEGVPAIDLMLLGLGADAHTASLFPRTSALWERRHFVVANAGPEPGTRRLTATFPLINAARSVCFVLSGAEKASALARVLEGEHDVALWPAQAVSPHSGEAMWIVDAAAAVDLSTSLRGVSVEA